MTPLKQMGAIE